MNIKIQRDFFYVVVIILLLGVCGQLYYSRVYRPAHEIAVYYNHDRQLNSEIISVIRDADKFVYFAVYTFTRQDIQDALLAAKYRGLTVVGITDKDQLSGLAPQKEIIKELEQAGIPVYVQDHSGIMHMKVVVTDKAYASGSFNWTSAAATINDEVLEVGRDEKVRDMYQHILEEVFQKYGGNAAQP